MKKKISLIGAGQIGGTLAHLISIKELGDIVLFDVAEGVAKGKALDIAQSTSVDGHDINLKGTSNYEDIKNSDIIIITAGVPRKPGMTRDDLLGTNLKIIKQVAEGIKKNSPNSFVICITNPLDVIVMAFQKYSGLPTNKVVGMAGITMVPMPNHTFVNKKPISQILKKEKLDLIIDRTRKGGAEIVRYLEKGSAFYAPASSGVDMAEAYIKNSKKTLPCAAFLNGEYGFQNVYAGVPVVIGNKGVEKIVELTLDKNEKINFDLSVKAVKELFEAAIKIDNDLAK